MSTPSPYKDIRQDFFKKYFEKALIYAEYLATAKAVHQQRWRNNEDLKLSVDQLQVVQSWKRQLNVLVMSGTWCGDCARQGPILKVISESCSLMKLRFIDNQENPELQDELKINGANKVPIVVSLSEDFFEVGRFGDNHLSVYRRKLANELGAVCDPGILRPEAQSLDQEISEWVAYFDRLQILLRLSPMLRQRYKD